MVIAAVKSDEGHFAAVAERGCPVTEADEIRALDRRRFAGDGEQFDAFRARNEDAALVSNARQKRDFTTLINLRRLVVFREGSLFAIADGLAAATNEP